MHDVLTVGIPVFVILFGILLNQRGLDKLEARLDRMQADLSMFYRTLGQHDADIEHLKKNRTA
jgi:hypothetical protein